jgi:hypothetical protein
VSELLPCPFCGKTKALETLWSSEIQGDEWDGSNDDMCQIVCSAATDSGNKGCGSSSGFKLNEELAVELWNTRHIAASKAQTVDVGAIHELIDGMRIIARLTRDDMTRDTFSNVADKLDAALPKE